MKRIDLHVHSNVSDGTDTPAGLVAYALSKGLAAMALTDHDTVGGVAEALRAAEGTGLRLIPGVELSAEYQGKDIHILGLFLDHGSEPLLAYLTDVKEARDRRNERMAKLLAEHGMPVPIEELQSEFPGAILTRAHFAKLLKKKSYVESYEEAFERYLGDGKPCYLPKERISPGRAIALIHKAGGLAVLAHPLLYHMEPDGLRELLRLLREEGLDGLEAIYSMNSGKDEQCMRRLAADFGLLVSGGSDYHGATKPHIDLGTGRGDLSVPEDVLIKLEAACGPRADRGEEFSSIRSVKI